MSSGSGEPDELHPDDAPPPVVEYPRNQAIMALAGNLGVMLFCFPLGGIVGSIVAGIGLARVRTRPESARALVRWAWIVCAVSVALSLALAIWTVATNQTGGDAAP